VYSLLHNFFQVKRLTFNLQCPVSWAGVVNGHRQAMGNFHYVHRGRTTLNMSLHFNIVHTVCAYIQCYVLITNSYTNGEIQYSNTYIQTPACFDTLMPHLQGTLHLRNVLNNVVNEQLKTVLCVLSVS
jgi:hypothetical protein